MQTVEAAAEAGTPSAIVAARMTRLSAATVLRALAYLLAATSAMATVLGMALDFEASLGFDAAPAVNVPLWPDAIVISGFAAAGVGAIIVYRQPRNAVAWLLVASGVSASLFVLANGLTQYGLTQYGLTQNGLARDGNVVSTGPDWLAWSAWVTGWAWIPTALIAIAYLPQVFPDARPLPRFWWRLWWHGSMVAGGLLIAFVAAAPVAPKFPELANPLTGSYVDSGAMAPLFAGAEAALLILFLALSAGAIVSILIRFARTDNAARRKIALVCIASIALIVTSNQPNGWISATGAVVYLGTILYAVARHGLWEIDGLISRTAVGIVLLVLLGAAYLLTVAAMGAIFGQVSGSLVAAFTGSLVVAALFNPVRRRVRTVLERVFALGRPDARGLGVRMSAAARAELGALQSVAAAACVIQAELHTPGFVIECDNPPDAKQTNDANQTNDAAFVVPLHWQRELLGRAILPPRPGAGRVHPADRRVLLQLEPALATVVHDAVLTIDLELSRRAVVTAREEERRRLRRDLHDGLGPLLAGAALSIGVARDGMLTRPEAAVDLMGDAASDLDQAIRDIRDLVHGLRPPALDDLGLIAAIGTLVPAETLHVRVDVDGDPTGMPAAAEVATFRIVQEALTNVMRHARARSAVVTLRREPQGIRVTIADDGIGIEPPQLHTGVGTMSMAERAAELGGTLTVTSTGPRGTPMQGTRVQAFLPISPGAASEGDGAGR